MFMRSSNYSDKSKNKKIHSQSESTDTPIKECYNVPNESILREKTSLICSNITTISSMTFNPNKTSKNR